MLRKQFRTSSTNRPGCSNAGKCPPRGGAFQWMSLLNIASAHARGGRLSSRGNSCSRPAGRPCAGARGSSPVQPCRRRRVVRQPVQHDVVEQFVTAEDVLGHAVAIGPFAEFLVDPRGLPRGRIGEAVGERLRTRRLLLRVARAVPLVVGDRIPGGLLRGVGVVGALRRNRHHGVKVNRGEPGRTHRAQRRRHRRSPVTALGDVALVAEPAHQFRPHFGDARDVAAGAGRLVGKAVAGQRGRDDVERVRGRAAVRDRVGERTDDLVELDHRAGPTVRHDQRHRARVRRAHVQEVNAQPVDLGAVLAERVQHRLAAAPVVIGAPVVDECAHAVERCALRPVVDRLAIGPARGGEPAAKVVEIGFADVQREGMDRVGHRNSFKGTRAVAAAGRGLEKEGGDEAEDEAGTRPPLRQGPCRLLPRKGHRRKSPPAGRRCRPAVKDRSGAAARRRSSSRSCAGRRTNSCPSCSPGSRPRRSCARTSPPASCP